MGCPLAAAAFVLALHTALTSTREELTRGRANRATTTAYMDDINILVSHQRLSEALLVVKSALGALGLQLNDAKTECWIDPDTDPFAARYQGIPRAKRPVVLKTTAEPIAATPDNRQNPEHYLHENAPELQRLLVKRSTTAARLKRLQAQGLSTHVAQALWRTVTASDSPFAARTTGFDSRTASELDKITTDF